jgi:streptogramin lyase
MNDNLVLTDDLLRRALEHRMAHLPAPQLLERIVSGAAGTAQDRTPRQWLRRRRAGFAPAERQPWWSGVPALGGAAAIALTAVLLVLALRPVLNVPGATPSAVPGASASPSAPPSVRPPATPESMLLGDHPALRASLTGADPIDVELAFGSLWTAGIHGPDVRRFDPATLVEQARIPVPSPAGPAWFVATDEELWVTNQLGSGLTRIDPATNSLVGTIGSGPTCGAPVVSLESIWQSYCDGSTFQRLDPVAKIVLDTFPAEGHSFLVALGDRLITSTSTGLAEMDPDSGDFTDLPGTIPGFRNLFGTGGTSDGTTVWVQTDAGVERINPNTGESVATFPYVDARSIAFIDGRAWLTVRFVGAIEIDLATNTELQTVPLQSVDIPLEAAGVLYVTDFDNRALWRIEP